MLSKFYLVEKNGTPAIWQSEPQHMSRLLKWKIGFTVVSESPSDTRAEALTKLRELFPECRRFKSV
jgi:hypothetical protein